MGATAIDAIAPTAPKLMAIGRHGDSLTQLRVLAVALAGKERGQAMPRKRKINAKWWICHDACPSDVPPLAA